VARNPARIPSASAASRRASPFGFFGEVFSELRKVSWPTRQEATRLALLVLSVAVSMGLLLGFVDMGFSRFISFLSSN